MFQFCFNDCIPQKAADDMLVGYLSETLKHYSNIKCLFPKFVEGIITDRQPANIYLNESQFSLSMCIQYLDRELRKVAFSNFNKFPIEDHFMIADTDDLLNKDYSIKINNLTFNALNIKIAQENSGILFTLPVHDELKNNRLFITSNDQKNFEIINQHGEDFNTNYIIEFIKSDVIESSKGFEKLLALIGKCYYDKRFKADFEELNSDCQKIILSTLEMLIRRNLKTRFYPDDKHIKDVTPAKENIIKVFELRIFSPVAVRVYFYETVEVIYFGSIEGKPKKKVQDTDIMNAVSIINELIILNG